MNYQAELIRGGSLSPRRYPVRRLCAAALGVLMVFQVFALLCALARPAYAYVDPGSGFLALQMLSTTFAGMIFMARKRLRNLFRRKFSEPKDEDAPE
jgi:hypothetical protein